MKYHWLFLGSAIVVTAAAACTQKVGGSGSSTSSPASGPSTTTGGGSTSTTGMGGAGTGGSGTGGKCSTPGTLHPPMMGTMETIYCPFSGMNGGKNIYCTKLTQHCCEPFSGTSKCVDIKTACDAGNTDWTCQDPSDCPMGQKCCSNDGATLVVNPDVNCANYATMFKGTVCAASCAATQITMCTDDAACGSKKCTPFNTKGAQVGGCH
jgi:hypothetical protein